MKSDIVLEEIDGKRTGFGLAFFPDEKIAIEAKHSLNMKKIGGRYIELLMCSN
jgi:hypothetical protein